MRFEVGDKVQVNDPEKLLNDEDFPASMKLWIRVHGYGTHVIAKAVDEGDNQMFYVEGLEEHAFYNDELIKAVNEWD